MPTKALVIWAVCAATWIVANVAATFQALSPSTGGLGAVSMGVEPISILLLIPLNLALRRSARRSGGIAITLYRAHSFVAAGYVLLLSVAVVLLFNGHLTDDDGEMTRVFFGSVFLAWSTVSPVQAFFAASALTLAAKRASETVAPTTAAGIRWRVIASVVLVIETAAAAYLAFMGWLLATWLLDDSQAARMGTADWYLEAASRVAVAILTGAIFAGLAYLVNIRTVARGFSVRVATSSAILLGVVTAVTGLAGAAWSAITKPWL